MNAFSLLALTWNQAKLLSLHYETLPISCDFNLHNDNEEVGR
jgi:hypothetical protein